MTTATKTTWRIDPNHSQIQFKVKHLALSNVAGTFKVFSGEVQSEHNDFINAAVHFDMNVNSLDTNNNERDKHLKSPDFFNPEGFPKIVFDGVLQYTNGAYALEGELTIKDVKHKIHMPVEYTGTAQGRFNDTRAGFEINGKIKRSDYNLRWNILTDAGNLVIGDDIKLQLDVQLIRQG